MIKFLKVSAFIAITLYIAALAALYLLQRKVLYIPPPHYLTPAAMGIAAEEVPDLNSPDALLGWWITPQTADAPVIMFFHGNGSAVFSKSNIYRDLADAGYGVFALTYPGYPGGAGAATQASLTQAAIDGYDYVQAQGVGADRVVFYGTSLGAGIAAQLSTRRRPALLVMEVPFISAASMAQFRYPMFPSGYLTKDKFDSRTALNGADIPLLWLHGTNDIIIPHHFGQTLYDGYGGPKEGHLLEGGRHSDIWHRGGKNIIIAAIDERLNQP